MSETPITRFDFVWDYEPSRTDFAEQDPEGQYVKFSDHEAVVRELRETLAHAAVPLEGLTLAAHMTRSNMGLSKETWDEINNAVSRIRAVITPPTP